MSSSMKLPSSQSLPPQTTAVAIVWGGIGDVFLASAGLEAFRIACQARYGDTVQLVVCCEKRSQSATAFLHRAWHVHPLEGHPKQTTLPPVLQRGLLFWQAFQALRQYRPVCVVTNGTHPLLPCLLAFSGAAERIGYTTPKGSVWQRFLQTRCLTHPVPLRAEGYAGAMYAAVYGCGEETTLLVTNARPVLALRPHDEALTRMPVWLAQCGLASKHFVLVHPGSSTLSKQKGIFKEWALASWVTWLETYLATMPTMPLVLVGGPDDAHVLDAIQQAPSLAHAFANRQLVNAYGVTTSMQDLAVLIHHARAFVCIDSSPLQLGIASDTPVVTLFGPTDPHKIIPPDVLATGQVQVVQARAMLTCRPCLWEKRTKSCASQECLEIHPEDVQQAVKKACQYHY